MAAASGSMMATMPTELEELDAWLASFAPSSTPPALADAKRSLAESTAALSAYRAEAIEAIAARRREHTAEMATFEAAGTLLSSEEGREAEIARIDRAYQRFMADARSRYSVEEAEAKIKAEDLRVASLRLAIGGGIAADTHYLEIGESERAFAAEMSALEATKAARETALGSAQTAAQAELDRQVDAFIESERVRAIALLPGLTRLDTRDWYPDQQERFENLKAYLTRAAVSKAWERKRFEFEVRRTYGLAKPVCTRAEWIQWLNEIEIPEHDEVAAGDLAPPNTILRSIKAKASDFRLDARVDLIPDASSDLIFLLNNYWRSAYHYSLDKIATDIGLFFMQALAPIPPRLTTTPFQDFIIKAAISGEDVNLLEQMQIHEIPFDAATVLRHLSSDRFTTCRALTADTTAIAYLKLLRTLSFHATVPSEQRKVFFSGLPDLASLIIVQHADNLKIQTEFLRLVLQLTGSGHYDLVINWLGYQDPDSRSDLTALQQLIIRQRNNPIVREYLSLLANEFCAAGKTEAVAALLHPSKGGSISSLIEKHGSAQTKALYTTQLLPIDAWPLATDFVRVSNARIIISEMRLQKKAKEEGYKEAVLAAINALSPAEKILTLFQALRVETSALYHLFHAKQGLRKPTEDRKGSVLWQLKQAFLTAVHNDEYAAALLDANTQPETVHIAHIRILLNPLVKRTDVISILSGVTSIEASEEEDPEDEAGVAHSSGAGGGGAAAAAARGRTEAIATTAAQSSVFFKPAKAGAGAAALDSDDSDSDESSEEDRAAAAAPRRRVRVAAARAGAR